MKAETAREGIFDGRSLVDGLRKTVNPARSSA
jgi:hypothetical protein